MLDTNIAIHLRDRDDQIMEKVEALSGAVILSIVTFIELEGGVHADPAQALVHRATFVTRNAGDFRDIPGLEILAL